MDDVLAAWESFDHAGMVDDLVEHVEWRDFPQCPSYHAPRGALRDHHRELAPASVGER